MPHSRDLKILSLPSYLVLPNDAMQFIDVCSRQSTLTSCLVSQGNLLVFGPKKETASGAVVPNERHATS
jgi:hypothetical protein